MGKNKYLGAASYIDTILDFLIGALCLEKESKFYLTRQISALPFSPTDFDSLVGQQARTVLHFLYERCRLTTSAVV